MSEQSDDMTQRLRERAHALWEKEGCPDGRSDEFWHRAQSEIESEANAVHAPTAPPTTQDEVDAHLEQSFPASDPPSHGVIVGPEA